MEEQLYQNMRKNESNTYENKNEIMEQKVMDITEYWAQKKQSNPN